MVSAECHHLVLGTAQLGMPYGVANATGQPDTKKAKAIVKAAWESGIHFFDTAQAYGTSEHVLAQVLHELGIADQVCVLSKIDPTTDHTDFTAVRKAVQQSADLFGTGLGVMMLHREDQLLYWSEGLGDVLRECRQQGMFQEIGISVYEPKFARQALETQGIDLVQIPANMLDRRHEYAGVMSLAKGLGKKIMIRSIFLQGALLLPTDDLPEQIRHARRYLEPLTELTTRTKKTARELALGYVRHHWPECLAVFGAEQPDQVLRNVVSWKKELSLDILWELDALGKRYVPLELLRPDLWETSKILAVGRRVRLRFMRPSDAWGKYVQWMNDTDVTRFLESRFRSYTSEQLEEYILSQHNDPSVWFLAIEDSATSRHVGNLKISMRNALYKTAEIGILIGAKDCWGRGYATEAIGLAADAAFDRFSIRKLFAGCYQENVASQHAFLKNGFIQEGRLQDHVVDRGTLSDVILLARLRDMKGGGDE